MRIGEGFRYFNHIVDRFYMTLVGDISKDDMFSRKNLTYSCFPMFWYKVKYGREEYFAKSLSRLVLADRENTLQLAVDLSLHSLSKVNKLLVSNQAICARSSATRSRS